MTKLLYITVILALISVATLGAPYQELVPKPGHVAVYIRKGDTPLSEIHPKLAEAFNEEKSAKLQLEDKTPETVPEVKEDNEELKEIQENGEIPHLNDDVKVEEVTASDIAEFDDVKYLNTNEEPQKIEGKQQ